MSAPNWLGDAQPYQNGENAAFNGAGDPSLAYMQIPSSASFDYNQLQAQQLQQRIHNGGMLNGSPAPQNSMYQTQSTVPSKRPRPREDSMAGSPRSYNGGLPVSRSQTPHGPYTGYSGPVNGSTFAGTNVYQNAQQNAQQNASTTSQSPGIQSQGFNPPNAQQRVQTMSPSPFSPATQNFGNHTSPAHSENGSRVNTPQNNGPQYVSNPSYVMGANQSYVPQPGSSMSGTPQPSYGQASQQDQMMMEARIRQMGQMGQVRPGGLPQSVPVNPMGQPISQASNVQMAQMRAQQAQQAQSQQRVSSQYNQMLQNMIGFARSRNLPFEQAPVIYGKKLDTAQLFFGVMKMQGSNMISSRQMWPLVAQHLQYPPPHLVRAGQEIQNFWHHNLAQFEAFWVQRQQQQRQQQHRAMADPSRATTNIQPGDGPPNPPQFAPSKPTPEQAARIMQPPANLNAAYQTPPKQSTIAQGNSRGPLPNGYIDPQRSHYHQTAPADTYNQPQNQGSRHQRNDKMSKSQPRRPKVNDSTDPMFWQTRKLLGGLPEMYVPRVNNLAPGPQRKTEDDGKEATWVSSHGGLPIEEKGFTNSVESLLKFKLRAPLPEELGPIDIRTLILSIRSGISGEVRHALDTIASLSIMTSKNPPSLDQCDDLVDALVECASDQVDLLAEQAPEVSDAILIDSYEETVRGSKAELENFQGDAAFGSLNHDLDKAVERLICITTIFRNFSFFETSHRTLIDPIVLKMLVTVIRYLGTRNMLLRTHRNALDFSKDVVVFLSLTAHYLTLQTKEEAMSIIHFLVSFAPMPEPFNGNDGDLTFSSYTPSLNRYLPYAVDAMAKLLTREPNRTLCRSVFVSDVSSTPPFELLTKAFGLAISPIPEMGVTEPSSTITYRIAFMVQGLLAAEILIAMIPNTEHSLAAAWLESHDGFASRTMRMLASLSRKLPALPPNQQHAPHQSKESLDPYGYVMVTNRGLTVIKKLIERAREADGDAKTLPFGTLPNKQTVIGALTTPTMDGDVLRQLCNLYSLET